MSKVYGIDLGTTYSVIAQVDANGKARVLQNDVGRPTTPSVVYFPEPGRVVIGEDAKNVLKVSPDETVAYVKRSMGTQLEMDFHGRSLTPESISALILKYLVASVVGENGDQVQAVITVPAYFGIAEREATQQAATIAGIEVLALVDEPVAAAISYGLAGNVGENVLVYDLGGGTFDTTVISIEERGPRVIVTDGVHTLGRILWDERLVNHLIEKFVELAQPPEDPYLDENFLQHVAGIAEELKKSLSARSEITTNLTFAGHSAGVTVSRSTFELLTSDLIAITLDVSSRALADAKTRGVARIDRIVLVGGSSRMPAVAVALKDRFEVDTLLDDPDFAVAKGAAVRAEFLARTALGPGPAGANSYALPGQGDSHGVVPRAVGVLIWDSHDPSGERRIVDHIIKRNEPVPTTATKRFATILEGQDQVRVQIYEQAGDLPSPDPGHNRPVLDGLISNLPKLRAGSPVDVTISLAADGRLRVRAVEPKSGADLTLESFIENIADSGDVERLTQIVGGISVLG